PTLGLVAHDHRKPALLQWVKEHRDQLAACSLCATGTTGGLIEKETGLAVKKFLSGPLGGDLQIGAEIAEGRMDLLVFFWDPLESQPHDPDVRALLRVAVLWNVPVAMSESSADLLLRGLAQGEYQRRVPDYSNYRANWAR
ncbi:MAG TPA: methylglyoxal synthase, partial [Verrucomicrobiaceae bacterium]